MFYFSILILLWILLRYQKMLCTILCKFSHVFILHAIPKNFHAFLSKFFWSFHRGFIEVFIDVLFAYFYGFFTFYTSIFYNTLIHKRGIVFMFIQSMFLKFYRSFYRSLLCIFWVIFFFLTFIYLHLQFKLHLYINVSSFLSQMFLKNVCVTFQH